MSGDDFSTHHEQQDPAVDRQLGWTPAELEPLSAESLRVVLIRDLRTEPTGATKEALRTQIESEQQSRIERGELRYLIDVENFYLYEPNAAALGSTIVETLNSVSCWSDLCRLVDTGDPAGEYALNFLWDHWESGDYEGLGFDTDSEVIAEISAEISTIEDLLRETPPDTPLELANQTPELEFIFVDPFNPWQMGVPRLIIDRYCFEWSSMVSTGTAASVEDLPSIGKTAHALGWSLREGLYSDISAPWSDGRHRWVRVRITSG